MVVVVVVVVAVAVVVAVVVVVVVAVVVVVVVVVVEVAVAVVVVVEVVVVAAAAAVSYRLRLSARWCSGGLRTLFRLRHLRCRAGVWRSGFRVRDHYGSLRHFQCFCSGFPEVYNNIPRDPVPNIMDPINYRSPYALLIPFQEPYGLLASG